MTNEPASLTGRIRIKICGIRTGETALAAAEAGADAIGFVFHPGSQRFIEPEEAFQVMADLPPFVATVGLFVNATLEKFCEMEERCPTTLSQLHGDEPEDVVRQCGPGVIKAVHFDAETIESELARWSEVEEVDAILVDGSPGGQGTAFDWSALAAARRACTKPLILAGGLTPENVGEAIRIVRPWAVDVSSGVESAPARKSPDLIRAFCEAVRRA
jgi:phosphoribosylanthranilate isomerase